MISSDNGKDHSDDHHGYHRSVRSFVLREGRITKAQQRALAEFWPQYGIETDAIASDFKAIFGRVAPVHLEIGFGNGGALADMAAANPQEDYLGVEVHRPGVGSLLLRLQEQGLTNVRVMRDDAKEVIARIPPATLTAVYLFFPDPWPKKRHHKRRLVQTDFARLVWRALKTGGRFHLATDWCDYADHMMNIMTSTPGFENISGTANYTPRPDYRPLTKFEQRGHNFGHEVRDLVFEKSD